MILVIIFYGSTTKTRHAYLPLLPAVKTSQPLVENGNFAKELDDKSTKIVPI